MALVQLTISALPAHVRTARLMATAVARRAGIAESALDEIRLAVGEACSRAVEAHRAHCPGRPITVELIDGTADGAPAQRTADTAAPSNGHAGAARRFEVVVTDRAPAKEPDTAATDHDLAGTGLYPGETTPPGGVSGLSPDVGLAVIVGLADEVRIEPGEEGTAVRMSWPLEAAA
ncbi:ATP-binding protein [Nocardiopsis suaedae]|uniref:ATP-binding protein n=1 Tax=Nocardiopsis suaedae TaxID=3018444 RepID=A0ABT4TU28_9ACTN|nr:ATP-binding protein [Nocardiopsis suaedae]MDA2808214.1 ATP-binding protein [Nocardiopsis suaedae]